MQPLKIEIFYNITINYWLQNCFYWFDFDYTMAKWYKTVQVMRESNYHEIIKSKLPKYFKQNLGNFWAWKIMIWEIVHPHTYNCVFNLGVHQESSVFIWNQGTIFAGENICKTVQLSSSILTWSKICHQSLSKGIYIGPSTSTSTLHYLLQFLKLIEIIKTVGSRRQDRLTTSLTFVVKIKLEIDL